MTFRRAFYFAAALLSSLECLGGVLEHDPIAKAVGGIIGPLALLFALWKRGYE